MVFANDGGVGVEVLFLRPGEDAEMSRQGVPNTPPKGAKPDWMADVRLWPVLTKRVKTSPFPRLGKDLQGLRSPHDAFTGLWRTRYGLVCSPASNVPQYKRAERSHTLCSLFIRFFYIVRFSVGYHLGFLPLSLDYRLGFESTLKHHVGSLVPFSSQHHVCRRHAAQRIGDCRPRRLHVTQQRRIAVCILRRPTGQHS